MNRNHVVVGIDGSQAGDRSALWAAAEAERRDAALLLAHGYTVPVSYYGYGMVPAGVADTLKAAADQTVTRARQAVLRDYPDLAVTSMVRRMHPVRLLQELSADSILTVVGSEGSNQFSEAVLGSVAARIAAHALGPVAVVRGSEPRTAGPVPAQIVVGLDGSANSETALSFAFEEASFCHASLTAVHSWNEISLSRLNLLGVDAHQIDEEERRALAGQLSGWSEKYPDVPIHQLILRGNAHASLLEYTRTLRPAENRVLLVVGSRGIGGFTGMMLGSTSQALIAHAPCPVVVVHGAR